jgi:hypothetical protein
MTTFVRGLGANETIDAMTKWVQVTDDVGAADYLSVLHFRQKQYVNATPRWIARQLSHRAGGYTFWIGESDDGARIAIACREFPDRSPQVQQIGIWFPGSDVDWAKRYLRLPADIEPFLWDVYMHGRGDRVTVHTIDDAEGRGLANAIAKRETAHRLTAENAMAHKFVWVRARKTVG